MQMRRTPFGCYGTVSNDGNRHKRMEKSLPDERSIRFFPSPSQTLLILLSPTDGRDSYSIV